MKPAARLVGSDRASLLCVVLVALLLLVPGLGARDLWDPDEPRTAAVTRGFVEGNTWAVPTLDGRPWLEKPPLYYWLAAAAARATGSVDGASARMPANLAAILTAVTVFFLGRALWGRRSGMLAALVLLTTEDFLIESRWARPDMLLGLLLTLAALGAWKAAGSAGEAAEPGATEGATGESPHAALWAALFWGSVGLAILTKGPVGLLPLAGVALHAAASRDADFLRRLRPVWGPILAILPAATWMAAWGAESGRPFPIEAILARFGLRFAEGIHHAHPSTHLLTTLPLALVPWVALLPAAIAETWPRSGRARDPRTGFLYALLIADLTLFALSAEKRGVYLLPMAPLVALLIGRLWDLRLYAWDPPRPARLIGAGFGLWAIAVAIAAAVVLRRLAQAEPGLLPAATALAAVGVAGAVAPLLVWRRAGAGAAIGLFAAGSALAALVVTQVVLPALDPYKSARRFGVEVGARAGDGPVGILGDPHAGIAWYADRPLTLLPTTDDLNRFLAGADHAHVVAEESAWEVIERTGASGGAVVEAAGRVGHRRFVLVGRGSP